MGHSNAGCAADDLLVEIIVGPMNVYMKVDQSQWQTVSADRNKPGNLTVIFKHYWSKIGFTLCAFWREN